MKIYVAGNDLARARKVMDDLTTLGHSITYDWVAEIEGGPTKEKAIAEAEAVRNSDLLVYLWAPNQESARYEAGMAMGLNKPIVVSGNTTAFFFQLNNVHCVESDELIYKKVEELKNPPIK
jgi:hypothetical protein